MSVKHPAASLDLRPDAAMSLPPFPERLRRPEPRCASLPNFRDGPNSLAPASPVPPQPNFAQVEHRADDGDRRRVGAIEALMSTHAASIGRPKERPLRTSDLLCD